jgi:hypothetical protein
MYITKIELRKNIQTESIMIKYFETAFEMIIPQHKE